MLNLTFIPCFHVSISNWSNIQDSLTNTSKSNSGNNTFAARVLLPSCWCPKHYSVAKDALWFIVPILVMMFTVCKVNKKSMSLFKRLPLLVARRFSISSQRPFCKRCVHPVNLQISYQRNRHSQSSPVHKRGVPNNTQSVVDLKL